MTDQDLQRAVQEALANHPPVHPDEISVEVFDGEVVLRGTVGSFLQQTEAADAASRVPGVRSISNELHVGRPGTEARADADTEAAVLDALVADHLLERADVDVEVRDGAVTLRGGVELAAQRDEIERAALAVPGVARVVNRLDIWLELSADEVLEKVHDAILALDDITVRIIDNDVTLTGTVSSREHRATALAAAARTPGVAGVNDELSLRSAPE
jgi:osmotically-inducible protein OsmY